MKLSTSAKVQADGVGVVHVENTIVRRDRTQCHCSQLCVVTAVCVIVTSLEIVLICALGVNSIQRDIEVDKLQQQVAELQQTVAILHHLQQKHSDTSHHQNELHTTQLTEVRQQHC